MKLSRFRFTVFFALFIAVMVLLCATAVHLPIPLFRGHLLERIRNMGFFTLCGWGLLSILSGFLLCVSRSNRVRLTQLLTMSLLGVASLIAPLWPFVFPPDSISYGTAERGTSTIPFRLLITDSSKSTSSTTPELFSELDADIWLAKGHLVMEQDSWTEQHILESRDGKNWVLFVKRPVLALKGLTLVPGSISGWRIDYALLREDMIIPVPPIFLFLTREEREQKDVYENYLGLRRLTGLLKQEKELFLISDLRISPWSGTYGILTGGLKLVNTGWGELTSLFDGRELHRGGLVHMKGRARVSEFQLLRAKEENAVVGRFLEFRIEQEPLTSGIDNT